jgi:hypothetical protein
LTAADDGLVPGTHYFFSYKYRNGEGDSPLSDSVEIAFADYPDKPLNPPFKIDSESNLTSIMLEWE